MTISYDAHLPNGPFAELNAMTKIGVIHCTPALTITEVHALCIRKCQDYIAAQASSSVRMATTSTSFKVLQLCYQGYSIDMRVHAGQTLESFRVVTGQTMILTVLEIVSVTMEACVVCSLL